MPPTDCVEPATDTWTGTPSVSGNAAVELTWTRVATVGCVDRFEPAGFAHVAPSVGVGRSCVTQTYDPATQPVAPDDGVLEIDRSTNPPNFRRDVRAGRALHDHALAAAEMANSGRAEHDLPV